MPDDLRADDPEGSARRARRLPADGDRRMSTATHHGPATHAPPRRRRTGLGRLLDPGLLRALWVAPLFLGLGILLVVGGRYVFSYHPYWKWDSILVVAFLTMLPLGFLVGHRRLRLLGALRDRRPDTARGPLGSRREELARLLPRQPRPQGHRRPVPGHDDRLLRDRRPAGDDHARRAGTAGPPVRRLADLQRAVLGARLADDLPVRDPGLRRARELRHPADDRRAGHGVPAPQRAVASGCCRSPGS